MKRFGILAGELQSGETVDVYATERKYWESLWYRPATDKAQLGLP